MARCKASARRVCCFFYCFATASAALTFDEERINLGVLLPFSEVSEISPAILAAAVYADLELGKYMQPPKYEFRRGDGTLIEHYLPIPNIHPNLTQIRLHFRDSKLEVQMSARNSLLFAYGSEDEGMPAMNAVLGPADSSATIGVSSIFSVLEVVQLTPFAQSEQLTDKSSFPYLFRVNTGESVYGVAMWDYLEFFKWRGGHLIHDIWEHGRNVRDGLIDAASERSRGLDVMIIDVSPDYGRDDLVNIAKRILASTHRLIFTAIYSEEFLGNDYRRIFMEEEVKAPSYQFVGLPLTKLALKDQASLQGHTHESFHCITEWTNTSDPSWVVMSESWSRLSKEDIVARLPDYGLDPNEPGMKATIAGLDQRMFYAPPPEIIMRPAHSAFNVLVRAFNAMLNDGFQPREIHGDKLREYVSNVDFVGFGQHVKFNENRDVIAVINFELIQGFSANDGGTLWQAFAVREASDGLLGVVTRLPGSGGPTWSTGETSWEPPLLISACRFGSRWEPRTPGQLPHEGLGTCKPCPGGHFSESYNALECEICPSGSVSSEGSSNCTQCQATTFAAAGSSVCTPCFAGSHSSETGVSSCGSCPEGTYQDEMGQTSCKKCPPGSHARSVRSTQCEQCGPGTMAAGWASPDCQLCSPGFFQSNMSSSQCSPCSPGSFASESGQSECSACMPGHFQPNGSSPGPCERCRVGSFSDVIGASECQKCSFGSTLLLGADSADLCTCPTYTFLYEYEVVDATSVSLHRECRPCNEYMEPCPGGQAPARQKERYHVTPDARRVYQCLSSDACPGGLLGYCPEGSSGPGCADCKEGSYYWSGDQCTKCDAAGNSLVIALPFAIIAVVFLIHRFGNDPIGQHLSSVSEGIVLVGMSFSVFFFLSTFRALDVDWKEPVATLMDISLIFSTKLMNVNVSCSLASSPSVSMALTAVLPLLIAMACMVLAVMKVAKWKPLFNSYCSIVYAVYLPLVLHGLRPFRYIIHPIAEEKSVLYMPSVFEGSSEHGHMVIVGISLLVTTCVPFAAACTWASFQIGRCQSSKQRMFLLTTFRFLFYKFKPRAYPWGLVILARNSALALAPSLFPEHPMVGVFVLAVVVVHSGLVTAYVWPWKEEWMNCADAGTLAYMALVLNLAVGWVRTDENSDGALATILVVVAGLVAVIAVAFALRLLVRIARAGRQGRDAMRAQVRGKREAEVAEMLGYLAKRYDKNVEVADAFDALAMEMAHAQEGDRRRPLAAGLMWVSGQSFDLSRVSRIATQIRNREYSALCFYDDCVAAFPELQLYTFEEMMAQTQGALVKAEKGSHASSTNSAFNSGLGGEAERLRTIGAFLAIYWICRLDIDGKRGLAFGVDEINRHNVCEVPQGVTQEELENLSWGEMSPAQRRLSFYLNFEWNLLIELFQEAGIISKVDQNGTISVDGHVEGRLVALLCLTAFHDIMKCQALCPQVDGTPYEHHIPGETIQDHDLALAYILDRHPNVLPSFRELSEHQQHSVRFTQSEMGFNAGWLVQAEGPPSAVLSKLKHTIVTDKASDVDVAFYFAHWVSDLAGAEPTPFKGAEKFSIKFPPKVLQGVLGCCAVLKRLPFESETLVYERYLVHRWNEALQQLGPLPLGRGRTARLRLHCMAQHAAKSLLHAFDHLLSEEEQSLLVHELSESGIDDQVFSEWHGTAGPQVGTPLLTYYGPAWCQRVGEKHPVMCLQILAKVCFNWHATLCSLPPTQLQPGQLMAITIQNDPLQHIGPSICQSFARLTSTP